jgi:hypothetical protein
MPNSASVLRTDAPGEKSSAGASLRQQWTLAFLFRLAAVRAVLIARGRTNIEQISLNNLKAKRIWKAIYRSKPVWQTRGGHTPRARSEWGIGKNPLPREGLEEGGDPGGGEPPPSSSRTQVLQALGVVRGCCAMKPKEKIEGVVKKR